MKAAAWRRSSASCAVWQRDEDVAADVQEQRPEHAVAQRVEAREAEERGRAEPGQPERARRRGAPRPHALLDQRRDDQRVEPQREARPRCRRTRPAGCRARQDSPSRMAGAHWVTATNDRRPISTSRNCPAAIRAQTYPRHDHQRGCPGAWSGGWPSRVLAAPAAQQERQDHVVRDHLGQRERVHDDHGRRRREAAEEDRGSRQAWLPTPAAAARTKLSACGPRPGSRRPAKAIGSTKTLMSEQVEREHPRGGTPRRARAGSGRPARGTAGAGTSPPSSRRAASPPSARSEAAGGCPEREQRGQLGVGAAPGRTGRRTRRRAPT